MAAQVAGSLAAWLPREEDGWRAYASTAFQCGCAALSALGHARLTDLGSVPVDHPALPDGLPRWDDIAVAVPWLADHWCGGRWMGLSGQCGWQDG